MTKRKTNYRSLLRLCWFALFAAVVVFCLYPVSYGLTRLFLVVAVPVLLVGSVFILRNRKILRLFPIVILAIVAIALILPGRSQDPEGLRKLYIDSLRSYEGTTYVWGGENSFGIDCSGLVRKGLINAHMRQGLTGLNPSGLRNALKLWWYDCTAEALKDGYRSWTRQLFTANSVNEIDHDRLTAGDLAVTSNGVHVMVYLSNNQWLEADPGVSKVITVEVPTDNDWFKVPVSIVRWKALEI